MTTTDPIDAGLRDRIIADPGALLDDGDLMRALVAANDRARGDNVVDMRGLAMDRLEARLDRLEDTHRSVIAAAYDNLAGTNQVHRAILRMLEPVNFETFLHDLGSEVAAILRVDVVRLVLESDDDDAGDVLARLGDVVTVAEPGFVDGYITLGRGLPVRQVSLRQMRPENGRLYGDKADFIHSEACLKLDFGTGRLPGMLVLGAEDPHQFAPQQGPDLLAFFAGVFERSMRRWLA